MYGVVGDQHDFACVARKVPWRPRSNLSGKRQAQAFLSFNMMHGPIVLDVTTSPRRTYHASYASCQISGSNRLDAAFSKQSKDRSVRCYGSKWMAFRHGLRLVQTSELKKDETATSRVIRTPTSLWEYQTSSITRICQHALGIYSERHTLSNAQAKTLRKIASSTLSEMFDELCISHSLRRILQDVCPPHEATIEIIYGVGAHSHRLVQV